ncbi:hypothetical protein LCGC14_0358680 [marine sediment metagenome]|uniref:Uncharacterized protein n=1 Tax=marine sediment metagenome TaxID=412755 RepID=A0A0F9WGT0_9ZZZZ
MSECKHTTNYYVEPDAPIVLWPDGAVKHVTYRCLKCKRQIYKEHPWENWKLAPDLAEVVG